MGMQREKVQKFLEADLEIVKQLPAYLQTFYFELKNGEWDSYITD